MEKILKDACIILDLLQDVGIVSHIEKNVKGDKKMYRVYSTSDFGYDVFCEIVEDSDNYELETYNHNNKKWGNLTHRKTHKGIVNYFKKYI